MRRGVRTWGGEDGGERMKEGESQETEETGEGWGGKRGFGDGRGSMHVVRRSKD